MSQCAVCASPYRAEIEQLMRERLPYASVCERVRELGGTLYRRSLTAHKSHMGRALLLTSVREAEKLVREAVTMYLGPDEDPWPLLEALNALHAIR